MANPISRRARGRMAIAFATAAFIALGAVQQHAAAQEQKPIRIVVAYGAGTSVDIAARAVGDKLALRTGRSVIIDNRPGANGLLAQQVVTRAAPNGETLLFTNHSPIVINPHLYAAAGDPLKQLAPVGLVAVGSYLLVAHPSTGISTMAELVRAARERPGQLTYSSYGVGSGNHLCMEMIQQQTGTRFVHVPYKTGSLADLVGGQVNVSAESIAQAAPYAIDKRLNAIAFTDQRMPSVIPGVPAVREHLPNYRCENWVALFAPAAMKGTPAVSELSEHVRAIVAMPETQQRIRELGLEPRSSTPEALEVSSGRPAQVGRGHQISQREGGVNMSVKAARSEIADGMRIEWDVPIVGGRRDVCAPTSSVRSTTAAPGHPELRTLREGVAVPGGLPERVGGDGRNHPEVMAGTTNKYQNWEVVDPEKWVPHGYAWSAWTRAEPAGRRASSTRSRRARPPTSTTASSGPGRSRGAPARSACPGSATTR